MKRLALILIAALLVIAALAYTWRLTRKAPAATIVSFLPADTIALIHVPSFNRLRSDWHRSDIYQLLHEPAVQEFLGQPLAGPHQPDAVSQTLAEAERLAPDDLFFALTSLDIRNPRFIGGFRFRGSRNAAEKILDKWQTHWLGNMANTKHEKIAHREHDIDLATAPPFTLATAYDGQWFFAASDLETLKQVLDRVDRTVFGGDTLAGDVAYQSAAAHLISDCAALFYLQPKRLLEKLDALRATAGQPPSAQQQPAISTITAMCGSFRFEKGKLHELLFSGMPRAREETKLSRSAARLGSADTFLYIDTLLDPDNFSGLSQAGGFAGFGRWLQKFVEVVTRHGVTTADWKAAFDPEIATLAEWPAMSHWPSIVLTVPVRNPTQAMQIADALTTAIDEDAQWTRTEKGGTTYFTMATPAALFAIAPTIGLSDQLLVASIEPTAVETAMARSRNPAAGLSSSQAYNDATRTVPSPTKLFAYADTGLFYSRLDSGLRPMLLLGAAFLPNFSNRVDLAKLPPAERVTKHLSPIVSSQRYDRDGYVVESVGPISFSSAAVLVAILIHWTNARQGAD